MSDFKITKPGLYRMRDGGIAKVVVENPEAKEAHRWVGWDADRMARAWFADGESNGMGDYADLIAEYREPAVMYVLRDQNGGAIYPPRTLTDQELQDAKRDGYTIHRFVEDMSWQP